MNNPEDVVLSSFTTLTSLGSSQHDLFIVYSSLSAGLENLIFKGDSLNVIDSIMNSATIPHWSISTIISDINVVVKSFHFYSFLCNPLCKCFFILRASVIQAEKEDKMFPRTSS